MKHLALTASGLAVVLAGCPAPKEEERLTFAEAVQAVEEASLDAQAQGVASGTVEIGTHFTIGGAVEAAAEELAVWVRSQLPCAAVTVAGGELTVEYGALPGSCTYRGRTYSGTHTVAVELNGEGGVAVRHGWTDVTNGLISVTGEATVTWTLADPARRVEHTLTWTRLSDGRSGTGTGDRTQRPLPEGLEVGFQEDGSRSWTGARGTWDLGIDGLQVRWVDPVPEAGRATLRTPGGKSLSLLFARRDADTIGVTVQAGRGSFAFDVTALGQVSAR